MTSEARRRGVDYGELRCTEESQYSCLMPYQFGQVAEIYAAEVKTPPARVLDATANVGCDSIQFSRMWPEAAITSVEIDPATAELLRVNMANLSRVIGRKVAVPVETRNADCVEVLSKGHQADLVYFDIPWGGPEYYKAPSMRLVLNNSSLGDVVGTTLAHNAPLVVAKVPVNADMDDFMGAVRRHTPHGAVFTSHDVVKPKANSKGAIAYRLVFVRARPAPVPRAKEEVIVPSRAVLAQDTVAEKDDAALARGAVNEKGAALARGAVNEKGVAEKDDATLSEPI